MGGNPLIQQWLLTSLLRRTCEGLLNLKDLLTVVAASGGASLSGSTGWQKRTETDLLILQGLLADFLSGTGEGLLNLKDLLTVLPPTFKGLLENEPALRRLFCAEMGPNSAIFCQNVAEYGRELRSCATDFIRTGQGLRGMPSLAGGSGPG